MKIRALQLTNVRRFAGGTVRLGGPDASVGDADTGAGAFFPVTVLSFDDPDTPEVHFVEAFGPVTSVLGYTDVDGRGNAGIERAFDEQLSNPATRGQPVTLSISSRVQQALEHELLAAMTEFSAIGAAGIGA